jgi:ABC-type antimicrobial peptide transport system permease subunit
LACIGIYGTMAYNVARRTSEIGVRMALGARSRQVLWMILRESSSLALVGIAVGLAAAFGLTRFIHTTLYGLQPTDPATFIPAALLLLVITIAAGYGPGTPCFPHRSHAGPAPQVITRNLIEAGLATGV